MLRNRPPSRQARAALAVFLEAPLAWRHGYELARLAGLSSGTLYPLLIRLHGRQLLEARWEAPERPGLPPRHAYRLSSQGVAFARALQDLPAVSPPGAGALAR